jgi:hypothetical protein
VTPVDPVAASRGTGVPVRTIQRWVRYGRLLDYGDGEKILVDPGEVQQLEDLRETLGGRLPTWRSVA